MLQATIPVMVVDLLETLPQLKVAISTGASNQEDDKPKRGEKEETRGENDMNTLNNKGTENTCHCRQGTNGKPTL